MNSVISNIADSTRLKLMESQYSSRNIIELSNMNSNMLNEESKSVVPEEINESLSIRVNIDDDPHNDRDFYDLVNDRNLVSKLSDLDQFLLDSFNKNSKKVLQAIAQFNFVPDNERVVHNYENIFESSMINEDVNFERDRKMQSDSSLKFTNKNYKSHVSYQKMLYYFESLINHILKKYKPAILPENGESDINHKVTVNEKVQEVQYFKEYIKFRAEMKEIDNKIIDVVSKNQLFSNNNKHKVTNQDGVSTKELRHINPDNSMLKLLILSIFRNPLRNNYYTKWKTYILNLNSKWQFQKETLVVKKMNLKYLQTKMIIEKLLKNKQEHKLGKNFITRSSAKSNNFNFSNLISLMDISMVNLPRLTFYPYTTSMIIYDLIVDIQLVFFLIYCPIAFVFDMQMSNWNLVVGVFNAIYYFHLFREYRRLRLTDANQLVKDLKYIFKAEIFRLTLILDILSLLPMISFFSNISNWGINLSYKIFILFPIFRTFNCGMSVEYIEKTKYAMTSRLILLIFKFLIFSHWFGLLFYKFVNFGYLDKSYFLEDECKQLVEGQYQVLPWCAYVISLYDGELLVPGSYFVGLTLLDTFSNNIYDYIYMFLAYFIGQIIVAYVFGGVSTVIKNMNQGANLYREKEDQIKSHMEFYEYDEVFKKDVLTYYAYIWQKKRNLIYKDLLSGLSGSFRVNINEHVFPHHRFFMKDFYGLSKNKEKKFISCIISNIKEFIAFPSERIYTQGELISGLFILTDGSVTFIDSISELTAVELEDPEQQQSHTRYDFSAKVSLNRKECIDRMKFNEEYDIKNIDYMEESTIFPLDSTFMKTGRAIETAYVDDFTDFFLIDLKFIDSYLIINFPNEMQQLRDKGRQLGELKIGKNKRIKELVFNHSSRSVGAFYEPKYTIENAWINIKYHLPMLANTTSSIEDNIFEMNSGLFEFSFNPARNFV